jgi:predicted enzyme related to lactoylglutathione lyase
MTTMTKTIAVGWFEIPVSNLARAKKFYETVFEVKLSRRFSERSCP